MEISQSGSSVAVDFVFFKVPAKRKRKPVAALLRLERGMVWDEAWRLGVASFLELK